jgi:carbon-monoxide dehydrogenase medium subunit
MKRPEPFEIYRPTSIREALQIRQTKGAGGYFQAGGTDLVIAVKEKGLVPKYVVDLKKISPLRVIREESDGSLRIGALVTMRELETSTLIRNRYPFLAQSAAEVGSVQIRNRATVGGNVANATPSADVAPALLVLDAEARISGLHGERSVPLAEFFVGPSKTVMMQSELLTEIVIPATHGVRGEYIKFSPREMMDLAYVGVAVALVFESNDKTCSRARIALGAVSPTPIRARKAEAILHNRVLTEELAELAGNEAATECSPISDVRSSAEYRREMVRVNTKRALLNVAAHITEPLRWIERRDRKY